MNGLRRSILNHVPTVAISTVHVLTNHSVMADEFLSHRLGLVPLVCPDDKDSDVEAEPFVLEARGPGLVTSGQLRHPTLRVVDPHLPLVLLGEKQEIHLRAHARWGTGQEHARFSPVAPVFYRFLPHVEVTDIEDWGALQAVCPRGVFRDDGSVNANACTFCGECTRTGVAAARVHVAPEAGQFELTVEGTGASGPARGGGGGRGARCGAGWARWRRPWGGRRRRLLAEDAADLFAREQHDRDARCIVIGFGFGLLIIGGEAGYVMIVSLFEFSTMICAGSSSMVLESKPGRGVWREVCTNIAALPYGAAAERAVGGQQLRQAQVAQRVAAAQRALVLRAQLRGEADGADGSRWRYRGPGGTGSTFGYRVVHERSMGKRFIRPHSGTG